MLSKSEDHYADTAVRKRRACGLVGCANGRELVTAYGLLRNSTNFAAQNLGLGQCPYRGADPARKKPPVSDDKLKLRPIVHTACHVARPLFYRESEFLTVLLG